MNQHSPHDPPPPDLGALLAELAEFEETVAGWDAGKRNIVEALRAVIEQLHGEALRRLLKLLKSDSAAFAALKSAAGDEFVYAVLRRHALIRPSLNERVEEALAGVRPMLAGHGGDVELVRIDPPLLEVRFTGACDGCAASLLTFHAGVKKAVQQACPEITDVRQVKGQSQSQSGGGAAYTSPFALEEGEWRDAGALAALADDAIQPLTLKGEALILYRRGAAVTCFGGTCAHMGRPLQDGHVADGVVTCRHHGFRFELASGQCRDAPDLRLDQHAVRILDGRVQVRL